MYLLKIFNLSRLKAKEFQVIEYTHGVFAEIHGKGVLIIGKSGVGKSEVVLDLIVRGHKLIADDSVAFFKKDQNTLIGKAPSLLENLMEVRGLGILDIKKLFGRKSVTKEKKLFLVVELKKFQKEIPISRLEMNIKKFKLLEVHVPKIELPINETRHLSLLVETAIKNYMLIHKGSNTVMHLTQKINLQLSLDH